MAVKKDYYEVLGVSKNDDKDSIKKAYKKLAMKYHPDRASKDKKEECEKRFKEISEAYTILGDDKKRRQYDSVGHETFGQGGYQGNPFQGEDISSMFRDIFESNFFHGTRGGSFRNKRTGEDLQYELIIDFKEAAFGCEKEIYVRKNIICSQCEGTGAKSKALSQCDKCEGRGRLAINQRTPFGILRREALCDKCEGQGSIPKEKCKECGGEGIINTSKKIKIRIPEGIDNEQILKVIGEGNAVKNGESGDLLLIIRVKPHKIFKRDHDDIYMELPITFSQAALGCEILVPTLSVNTKIKIPSGTESGTIMRLKNKGIRNVNRYKTGDQFINIKVETPKKLNRKQRALFKELSELE